MEQNKRTRHIEKTIQGTATQDGAGVKLTRIIGQRKLHMLDPFLLLDCFESDDPDDYIAGFPEHPHRGFETVTYIIDGKMRHKDSQGNEGVIGKGGVQWMTAGKGILHSEMPEQEQGLLKGFQLWVNLPSADKMTQPAYQEFPAEQIATEQWENGSIIKVIAGCTDSGTQGPVINQYTQPTYLDVQLKSKTTFTQQLPVNHNAFIYMLEGELQLGNSKVQAKQLAILTAGEEIQLQAHSDSRFLLIAGKPLQEPVARYGPFVMNTQAQINQAMSDYQQGKFS